MANINDVFDGDDLLSLSEMNIFAEDILGSTDYMTFYYQLVGAHIEYKVQTRPFMMKQLGEEAYNDLWRERNEEIAEVSEWNDYQVFSHMSGIDIPVLDSDKHTPKDRKKTYMLQLLYEFLEEDTDEERRVNFPD